MDSGNYQPHMDEVEPIMFEITNNNRMFDP